jgi:hypothetical protein
MMQNRTDSESIGTDFFISYTSRDKVWAEWIAWQLEEAGYATVLQAWDFRPGANFVLEMQRAVSESDRTIAVLSQAFVESIYASPEWAAAFRNDPTGEEGLLIPVRIQDFQPPGLLGPVIHIDLVGLDADEAGKRLLEGVRRGRAKPSVEPPFPKTSLHEQGQQPRFPGEAREAVHAHRSRARSIAIRFQDQGDLHFGLHRESEALLYARVLFRIVNREAHRKTLVYAELIWETAEHEVLRRSPWAAVKARDLRTLTTDGQPLDVDIGDGANSLVLTFNEAWEVNTGTPPPTPTMFVLRLVVAGEAHDILMPLAVVEWAEWKRSPATTLIAANDW